MCTQEEQLPSSIMKFAEKSPLMCNMLGLKYDKEEEGNENREPRNSCLASPVVNGERELGIIPLTFNVLLNNVEFEAGSKGVKIPGNSLLDKIKVKRSPEPSDESTSGSAGAAEEGKAEGRLNRTCTKCDRTFVRRCDYNKHMNSHAGQRKYCCPICKKQFTRSNHVYRHLQVHDKAKEKRNEILKSLKKKTKKKKKVKQVAEIENDSGMGESGPGGKDCLENGVALQVPSVRDVKGRKAGEPSANGALVASVLRPPLQCNVCHKLFKHRKVLLQHLRNHHPSHPFICCICRKSFTSTEELAQHRRNHQQHRPHKCATCNKTFTRSSHLKRHMALHTKDRILECSVCLKQFTNSRNFQSHVDSHARLAAREAKRKAAKTAPRPANAPPKDRPRVPVEVSEDFPDDLPLDLSKSSTVRLPQVKGSSDSHQPNGHETAVEKNHKLCPSLTLSPTKSLRMNGHASVQSSSLQSWKKRDGFLRVQHKCTSCDLVFSLGQELMQHWQAVHPVCGPYLCCACDVGFAEEGELLEHVRARHEEPFPL